VAWPGDQLCDSPVGCFTSTWAAIASIVDNEVYGAFASSVFVFGVANWLAVVLNGTRARRIAAAEHKPVSFDAHLLEVGVGGAPLIKVGNTRFGPEMSE
jgi:hypothetical protein